MTERTVTKQSLRTDEEDSISINSTQESEADEDRSYVVDRILAEQDDDEGNKYYLIRWDGYDVLASTWEPAENIEGQATLDDWTDEKMRIARELSKEFDVAAFENELERLRIAKEDRRQRRKAKRERLSLATSFSGSEEDIPFSVVRKEGGQRNVEAELIGKESEEPVRRTGREPGSKSKPTISKHASDTDSEDVKNTRTGRVKRRTINLPTQDHTTDTSEDSFVEEVKQEAPKVTAREKRPRATTNRKSRDALSFVSDEASSLSRSTSPFGLPQKSTQRKSNVEVPSRTGYQGTAHRGTGAVAATSLGHGAPATRGATRGHPRGRGRGGSRGQERASAETFSFTAPNRDVGKPKRKRSLANAILNAPNVDHSKPVEHFKTPSMVRKAELAARSLADRAPDMQSVGLLSRPSDYGSGRPIRKKSQMLREDSGMGQSIQIPAASMESLNKSKPPTANDEEKAPLAKESQIQANITERTANIDLYKKHTLDQITAEADRRRRDLPQGVPTGPRALIQEQSNTAAKQLRTPGSDVTVSTVLDDIDISPVEELQRATCPPEDKPRQPLKPVTKMNLKEYKSRRKSEFLGDAIPAQAIFGDQEAAPVLIGFTDIDRTHQPFWLPILSGIGVLNFNRTCIAQEFHTQLGFLQGNVLATGNIITGTEEATILEEIAEWLRPCSGLVFLHDIFCILIFPARCEEWKFLDSNSDTDQRLRYQIYEPKSPKGAASQLDNAFAETTMSSLDLKRQYLDSLVDLTQNIRYHALLPPHPEGQDVHNFYLLFPKKVVPSTKYIINWLRACNRDCRIYTNQKSGSWDMFTNNPIFKAGSIIIHESFLPSIFKIPHLARLINSNATFNFWCMDDGSCKNPFRLDFASDDTMPSCEASMIRLFPHGGAVFLTPSFLTTQPERTCDLLKWFQRKLSTSTPGTWRLVLPNESRQYLLDLAIEKASARERLYNDSLLGQNRDDVDRVAASQYLSYQECRARFQCYVMLDQLLKNEYMSGVPGYWEEDSPDDFESPIIYADERVDQNNEKALVTWFAGWTMLHLNLYRKFIVIGTTPLKRRANTSTTKSTSMGTELLKASAAAILQKPPTPQTIDPPATAAKRWNRNALPKVKDSPPSMPALTLKVNEPLNEQTKRRMSQSEDVLMDLGGLVANPRPTSGVPNHNPKISETFSRDSPQGSRTRHGIDANQPPAILEFIAITGTEAETAKRYLARYSGDVHTAVQKYWHSTGQSSSPQRLPQMDGADDSEDPTAVVDFIAGTHASAKVAERYLYLAQDDVRRAIALYNESQQYSRSPSGGLPSHDGIDVREDGQENSPSRRVGDPATLAGPVNRRRRPEDLLDEGSDTLNNNESRQAQEAPPKSRASPRETEGDLDADFTNYVRPDSTGLSKSLNKMNQVTPTTEVSDEVTNSRLLVKGAELSQEIFVRTLFGESVEGPETASHPDHIIKGTQIFREGQRNMTGELENSRAKDLHSPLAEQMTALEKSEPEGGVFLSYDGVDERQNDNIGRQPRNSGIISNEAGTRQFIPGSVRPSGTTRPEISVRPGYMPPEDKPVYKNRRIVGGIPQYEVEDTGNSSSGSRNSSTVQSPTGIEADTRRLSFPDTGTPLSANNKISHLDPNFETTVEWYDKLRKNGQSWEHIYVGGWEACFPRLMNVKR